MCVYFFHLLFIDMFVGFSSQTYTAFEITERATVCVEVLNPPFGGAIKRFNVSILPEEGIIVYICLLYTHFALISIVHHQERRFQISSTHLNAIEYCILKLTSHKCATITTLQMMTYVNLLQVKHSSNFA